MRSQQFYSQNAEVRHIWNNWDPVRTTWMISDLSTKFSMQDFLLKKNGGFEEDSLLRASDFWQRVLFRSTPHLRPVSPSVLRLICSGFVRKNPTLFDMPESSLSLQIEYLDILAPILLHPNGGEQMPFWFQKHEGAARRWKIWFLRSQVLIHHLIEEKKVISPAWIPSYLLYHHGGPLNWKKNLIVDLGHFATQVELDLMDRASQHLEVQFLLPQLSDGGEKSQIYRHAEFSSALGEIKFAVSQIKTLCDSGVPLEKMGVFAPQIERYWPILSWHLKIEGLWANKAVEFPLQALLETTKWLSRLRLRGGRPSMANLEMAYFQGLRNTEEENQISYEKFRALYQSLLEEKDLDRSEQVFKSLFEGGVDASPILSQELSVEEFVQYLHKTGKDVEPQILIRVLDEVQDQIPMGVRFELQEGLQFLEDLLVAKSISFTESLGGGIRIDNLASSRSYDLHFRFFLGLSEENLTNHSRTQILSEDVFWLNQDLGFMLNFDVGNRELQELKLLSQEKTKGDFYCFSLSDLESQLHTPSAFWLDIAKRSEGVHRQETRTHWDEIQMAFGASKVQSGQGEFAWKHPPTVSPSSLESYLKCPFIFAAQKYFGLEDEPDVELSVDHRTRGSLAHALFEELTKDPIRWDWSDAEILELLSLIRERLKLIFADVNIWKAMQSRYLVLARRFLEFERTYREQRPELFIFEREKSFAFQHPSGLWLRGKVDRVDCLSDKGRHYCVVDYKSSEGSLRSAKKWLEVGQIQLLFYIYALEKIEPEIFEGVIEGAEYLFFRKFKRGKGIWKQEDGVFWKNSMEEFEKLLNEAISKIQNGTLSPAPRDSHQCETCKWRGLCRAPHLAL